MDDEQRAVLRPEAGRLFLISCRRACRLGRDFVSVGRVFDLGFDPVGRASGLDFDSADLVYRWASCFLSSWGTEDNDGKLCSFQKNAQLMELFWMYPTRRPTPGQSRLVHISMLATQQRRQYLVANE